MQFDTLIEVEQLRTRSKHGAWVLLDCRFDLNAPKAGRTAFEDAHIPGAQYADLNLDLAGPLTQRSGRHPLPEPTVFAKTASAWGIGDETQTIVYDEANGSFAARAWWLLRWIGLTRVAVLNGGIAAWRQAGECVESGAAATRSPGSLRARPCPALALSVEEVIRALTDPGRLLVDARAADRYLGRAEPIDPVAGHVPGAVNFPFSRNLGSDGRFLPREVLRAQWDAELLGRPADGVISMCGSGVTACHNLLALEVAGLGGARLYPGSWSEWVRDPGRPVARGPAP